MVLRREVARHWRRTRSECGIATEERRPKTTLLCDMSPAADCHHSGADRNFGRLFTTLVGFSRVLFAAAADGQFFETFARVHPTKRFRQRRCWHSEAFHASLSAST
jgi:hypothetical protein